MITDCQVQEQLQEEVLSNALDVSYRGQVYPERPQPPQEQRQNALRLRHDGSEERFGHRLASELWARLPYATLGPDLPTESEPFIDKYIASLRAIDQFQTEVKELIQTLCEVNLAHRQTTGTVNAHERERARRDKVDEMISRADSPMQRPENALSAPVKVQPVAKLHEFLAESLRQSLADFGRQFEVILQQLAAQRMLGLIEWMGPNDCRYHYFKEFLVQDSQGVIDKLTSHHLGKDQRGQYVAHRTQNVEAGTTTHVWQRHEHHVMHAVETRINNSRIEMPPQVQRLIDALPDWLEDSITVVDGTIYRERVIEQTYRQERWAVIAEPVEERVYGWDPAIVIDHFVLTGWGPSEVEAEQSRRKTDAEQQESRGNRKMAWYDRVVWTAGACGTGLGAAALLATGWNPGQNTSLLWAALLIMLWTYAVLELVRAQGLIAGIASTWRQYSIGFAIAAGFLLSACLLAIGNRIASLPMAVLGVVLLAAALVASTQIPRLWEPPATAVD